MWGLTPAEVAVFEVLPLWPSGVEVDWDALFARVAGLPINDLMESASGLYKTELVNRHFGTYTGRAEVENETAKYDAWLNQRRPGSSSARISFGEQVVGS